MALGTQQNINTVSAPDTGQSYRGPLAMVTTLFFMWGFLTCLNDILIPHLKAIFDLSYAQVMLVQLAFFGAYAVFSIPVGFIIERIGYQWMMVAGLLTMGLGAILFIPAASAPSFPLFLAALIILAAGITALQVSANPYVAVLGPAKTASSRLTLTQAFNSFGTFIAPLFGGILILATAPKTAAEIAAMNPAMLHAYRVEQASSVKLPYILIAVALVLLAVVIGKFNLPHIPEAEGGHAVEAGAHDSIWKHRNLVMGAIAIFAYVGAEVSIGSFLVNYMHEPQIGDLSLETAAKFLIFYWGGAMVGRFLGSSFLGGAKATRMGLVSAASIFLVLSSYSLGSDVVYGYGPGILGLLVREVTWVLVAGRPLFALIALVAAVIAIVAALHGGRMTAKTRWLLGICAISASILVTACMLTSGLVAMWALLLVGLFNSIMFPSIFTLGIEGLGPLTGEGSGLLNTAIVGGAVIPLAQGFIADKIGIHHAFVLPVICYLYILLFAAKGQPNRRVAAAAER